MSAIELIEIKNRISRMKSGDVMRINGYELRCSGIFNDIGIYVSNKYLRTYCDSQIGYENATMFVSTCHRSS